MPLLGGYQVGSNDLACGRIDSIERGVVILEPVLFAFLEGLERCSVTEGLRGSLDALGERSPHARRLIGDPTGAPYCLTETLNGSFVLARDLAQHFDLAASLDAELRYGLCVCLFRRDLAAQQ